MSAHLILLLIVDMNDRQVSIERAEMQSYNKFIAIASFNSRTVSMKKVAQK